MRRTTAVIAALFTFCLAALVSPATSSASVRTWPDGRACSGSLCTVVHGAGQSNDVSRGHRVAVEYDVHVTGPAATAVLDVVGSTHLHLTGTATVNSVAAAKGSVTRNGTHVSVTLPSDPGPDERIYQVEAAATVDNTAYTDMQTSAAVTVRAGSATATARTSLMVGLDRPAVYVGSHPTFTLRAGHHRQMDAVLGNQATVTTRTATLWITLPAYTRLSSTWGVTFDNRRVRCTGSVRHYRCAISGMPRTLAVRGLLIDLRATAHAPHRYVGHIFLSAAPTGYVNGGSQNHSSTRVTIKR